MRLLIGFATAFCLLVYLAFMANDTSYSPDFENSLGQNQTGKNTSGKGSSELERTPASASGDDVSGQQKQEELLKRQSSTDRSISKKEGHSDRPYENTDDDYDRSLNARSNNYESLSANSARSPVRTSNSPKRGFSRPPSSSPNPTSQGNGNSEGSNDASSGTGETIITGGGFDDSSESQSSENESTDSNDEAKSSSSASGGGTLLSCQASQQGGMFSNPLSVELSCNASADIRYCLSSSSTCCDPDGPDSQIYNPAEEVLMGMENTDYCLSYYGDSNDLSQSTQIESYTYSFNSDFPELNVEFTKRWVQSTQINERAELSSSDFGKSDHLLGQINYLTHDISDPAFDESCYDMAMNNMGLNSPSPTEPLELFDVSGLSSTEQVDLYYSPDNLDYIENHLLSYIVNDTFDVPLISCQISTVTLEDFHITDSAPHLVSTSASGQIQGQFTPYGFFEETLPTRSPAGESNNEVDGRELRTNFLSILYQ